jgi:hypothetical protein
VAIPREVIFVSQIFSVQNMRYSFSSQYLSYLKCWVGTRVHFGTNNKRRGARSETKKRGQAAEEKVHLRAA